MHTLRLNIKDTVFDQVIAFLQHLPKDEISFIENRVIEEPRVEGVDWDYWSDEELASIGKIGFMSDSFEDDDEDYSKW